MISTTHLSSLLLHWLVIRSVVENYHACKQQPHEKMHSTRILMSECQCGMFSCIKKRLRVDVRKQLQESAAALCSPSCSMRSAPKLTTCTPWVSHAVLIALLRGLVNLMAASHNVFGSVCQHDHLTANRIWKTSRMWCASSLTMWRVHTDMYCSV